MTRTPWVVRSLSALLALYLIAPFLAATSRLGSADWTGADLAGLGHAALVSLASASLASLIVALGGTPLGYILARRRSWGFKLLGFVVQLPLALPPLTSGVLLLFLLGYASPLGRLSHGALTDSFLGVVLAETFVSAPFLIIAARSAFAQVDPRLEEVAATLGHGPWSVFRRVSLALSWRPVLAGMVLTWLRAFGEFGATVMMAYHPYTLPVFTYVAFGGAGLAAMGPVVLLTLALAMGLMALSGLTLRSHPPPPAAHQALAPLPPAPERRPGPVATGLELRTRRSLPGFKLDLSWRSQARRLAILGPSGSGKSMTLRMIAGLEPGTETEVVLGGRDLAQMPPERRGVGYVPQAYGLLPNLEVSRQIRFAADADRDLAAFWTARLGLGDLEGRTPQALSLGQQQRVALARALSRPQARLLLLDEPFSALDVQLRLQLRGELRRLQDEIGATTVLVTHDPAEAMALADELLLLVDGAVLQAGPAAALYARPVNELAARLLGAEIIGAGRAVGPYAVDVGGGVHLAVAGAPLVPGRSVGWAVAADQIRLTPEGPYPIEVASLGPVQSGRRNAGIRLGALELSVLIDPSMDQIGPFAALIDPLALQVWSQPED